MSPQGKRHHIRFEIDEFEGGNTLAPWQRELNRITFGIDTRAGRAFDIVLLLVILLSVIVVMLESVEEIRRDWGLLLLRIEWGLTFLFSVEYVLRLSCVERPWKYAFSFFGIIDLLAILPTYLAVFFPGSQSLIVIRALRLVRVFRVLKIAHCLREAENLWIALQATRNKIVVFVLVVLTMVLIMGAAMYLVEGPEHGFTNIPTGVYWAIVTMTTVGYGDISPATPLGKCLASIAMILGYSIIIVPTGIFSMEVVMASKSSTLQDITCGSSQSRGHEWDARFCRNCGSPLGTLPEDRTESEV